VHVLQKLGLTKSEKLWKAEQQAAKWLFATGSPAAKAVADARVTEAGSLAAELVLPRTDFMRIARMPSATAGCATE
jgi:hypothetical protein